MRLPLAPMQVSSRKASRAASDRYSDKGVVYASDAAALRVPPKWPATRRRWQSRLQQRRIDRQRPDAFPDGHEDPVADRRSNRRNAGLADASGGALLATI